MGFSQSYVRAQGCILRICVTYTCICVTCTATPSQVCDLYLRLVSGATKTMERQAHITGAMMGYSQVKGGGERARP